MALLATLVVLGVTSTAAAQDSTACDSCASCTTALAAPRARAHIESDLEITGGGACVVIAGANAQFDGRNHIIRGTASTNIAVQVNGASVLVRNVHAVGPGVGIEVNHAARTTVFRAVLETRDTGIRVTAADSLRVVRAQIRTARVGLAFGQPTGSTCAAAPLASVGAVVTRSVFERNATAIAACDAAPVLTDNLVVNNQYGVILGEPSRGTAAGPGADAPFDPCLCAPSLDHVVATTTVLYSSGCGGCQVHEGWLPDLRRSGHDIRARETGLEHLAEGQRFDDFVAQCVPEISDSLGIPGCVPNYACQASDTVFKLREGTDQLRFEARLDSSDDVAHFAETCAAFARQHYRSGGGGSCVRHALRGNIVCSNRAGDIVAAAGARRYGGAGNSCGNAGGWADEGAAGCAQPCPSTLPTTADAPSPSGENQAAQAHVAPAPAPEPAVAPAPAPAPNPTPVAAAPSANARQAAPSDGATPASAPRDEGLTGGKMALMIACLVGIAGLVFFALRKPG